MSCSPWTEHVSAEDLPAQDLAWMRTIKFKGWLDAVGLAEALDVAAVSETLRAVERRALSATSGARPRLLSFGERIADTERQVAADGGAQAAEAYSALARELAARSIEAVAGRAARAAEGPAPPPALEALAASLAAQFALVASREDEEDEDESDDDFVQVVEKAIADGVKEVVEEVIELDADDAELDDDESEAWVSDDDDDDDDSSGDFCFGCSEDVSACCCQRCPGCDAINPEGQRHELCEPGCSYLKDYRAGTLTYSD